MGRRRKDARTTHGEWRLFPGSTSGSETEHGWLGSCDPDGKEISYGIERDVMMDEEHNVKEDEWKTRWQFPRLPIGGTTDDPRRYGTYRMLSKMRCHERGIESR